MNPPARSSRPTGVGFAWGVLAILVLAVSLFAFHIRECFVDDAFTGFQYIQNLLAGHGFVFYPGERPVEGVTNIGWLLAIVPPSALIGPALAAKAAGLVLLLASLAMTMWLCRGLAARLESACLPETSSPHDPRPFGLTLIPMTLLACSFEFIYFSLAGMETALLALLLLLMASSALRRPASIVIPLLGALAFLVHPEAAAVYPLYAVMACLPVGGDSRRRSSNRPNGRRQESPPTTEAEARPTVLRGILVFFAAIAAITAIRFAYFGDVAPNTFHSKPGGIQVAVENAYSFLMGQNPNAAFPITGWLALPVLLFGWRRLRRASSAAADMLAAITAVGLIFAVYSPPDWTGLPRYFAPYLPAALIVLWSGVEETTRLIIAALGGAENSTIAGGQRPAADLPMGSAGHWPPANGRTRNLTLAVIAVVLVLTSIIDSRTRMSRMDVYPGYVLTGKTLIEPAKWLHDHLAADATIATRRIGVAAYYSGRRVFDYIYGLPDLEVARLVARRGKPFDQPTDPALKTPWLARAPEYLLEDDAIMDGIIVKAGGSRERFAIHGIEYHVIRQFPIGDGANWVLAERWHNGGEPFSRAPQPFSRAPQPFSRAPQGSAGSDQRPPLSQGTASPKTRDSADRHRPIVQPPPLS